MWHLYSFSTGPESLSDSWGVRTFYTFSSTQSLSKTQTHTELNIADGCTHPCPEASTLGRGFSYVLHPSITTLQFPNAASFFFLSFHLGLFNNGKQQTSNKFICILGFPQTQTFHLTWFVFVVKAPTYTVYAYSLVRGCFFSHPGVSEWPGVHEQQTKSKTLSIKASHSPVTGDKVNFFPNVHPSVLSSITSCNWSTMCGLLTVTLQPRVHTCARAQMSGRLLIDKAAGYSLTPNLRRQLVRPL